MDEKETLPVEEDLENSSNTPYDDVFRTMMGKSGSLRVAFLNEMFHPAKPISTDARIVEVVNEYFSEEGNGAQHRLITDDVIRIDGQTFHIECQSLPDGTILVRMFEYDIAIALKDSRYEDYHLTIDIPVSGVLFLRSTKSIPDEMEVTINAAGESLNYSVVTMKLSDYTLDDLIRKDLIFLFPFYIFNMEREVRSYDRPGSREKLASSVTELIEYINRSYNEGRMTYDKYLLVTDMMKKVTDNLSSRYSKARKELDEIMGGKILQFRGEELYNEGREEGRVEGRKEGREEGTIGTLIKLAFDHTLPADVAADRAESMCKVSKDKFMKMLNSYNPDDTLMQG
ncbi:MAG: hypothetical protein PUF90_02635 [Lachnospiraceae bacterium]|nr:hypothetical protein [Lachnospiraceae bacterium]